MQIRYKNAAQTDRQGFLSAVASNANLHIEKFRPLLWRAFVQSLIEMEMKCMEEFMDRMLMKFRVEMLSNVRNLMCNKPTFWCSWANSEYNTLLNELFVTQRIFFKLYYLAVFIVTLSMFSQWKAFTSQLPIVSFLSSQFAKWQNKHFTSKGIIESSTSLKYKQFRRETLFREASRKNVVYLMAQQ